MDAWFARVDARFDRLETREAAEHETMRRHLDTIAEQFRDDVKMLADRIGLNAERLDRHEKRITALAVSSTSSRVPAQAARTSSGSSPNRLRAALMQ